MIQKALIKFKFSNCVIQYQDFFSLTTNTDKGAAMTIILQESNIGHIGRCPEEEYLVAINSNNRILFHKKLGKYTEKKLAFPLVRKFLKLLLTK